MLHLCVEQAKQVEGVLVLRRQHGIRAVLATQQFKHLALHRINARRLRRRCGLCGQRTLQAGERIAERILGTGAAAVTCCDVWAAAASNVEEGGIALLAGAPAPA